MSEQYCIAMTNVKRRKEEHTLPLILEDDDKPILFPTLEEATEAANGYKQWHPEIEFEVREFLKRSTYQYEIQQYGTWMLGKLALLKI